MKYIVATLNPILAHLKYLLFTALLILALLLVAQFLFQNFNIKVLPDFSGDIKQTLLPFLVTASVSMYLIHKTQNKKSDSSGS